MLQAQLPRVKEVLDRANRNQSIAKREINFAILGYMTCSSLMLIINKLSIHNLPSSSVILWCQLFIASMACLIAKHLKWITLDPFDKKKLINFSIVSIIFLATIYSNIKILQYCNVETFIVFRSSTPIVVSIGDYLFLGRELPNMKSWLTLIGLILGSYCYVKTDSSFHVTGYFWVLAWYVIFSVDQLFIKKIVDTVQLNNWSRVYYTNLLSSIPLLFFIIYNQEIASIKHDINLISIFFLAISCIIGLLMSYFQFLARSLISAAYFTVVGNVCKIITVIINLLIWDKHANIYGLTALGLCLICAYFYEQAPLRSNNATKKNNAAV